MLTKAPLLRCVQVVHSPLPEQQHVILAKLDPTALVKLQAPKLLVPQGPIPQLIQCNLFNLIH